MTETAPGALGAGARALLERDLAEVYRAASAGTPDPGVADRLARYAATVLKWNAAYNLVRADSPESFITRHLMDSVAAALRFAPGPLVDVGSGAGLPGVVAAALDPSRSVVLVDSRLKRTRFLTAVRTEIALPTIAVVRGRAEALSPGDGLPALTPAVITARAFGTLSELVHVSAGLRGPRTVIQALKAHPDAAELEAAAALGFSVSTERYHIPGYTAERSVVTLTPGAVGVDAR